MRLPFGFQLTRDTISVEKQLDHLAPIYDRGTWWTRLVHEPFTGAWQRNIDVRVDDVLSYSAVYACITLIASDVGKLRIKLVEQDKSGIWEETTSAAFTPVLRKPNRYQNRIKFLEQWVTSKLISGNTYVLKQRDARRVVVALYVLDPKRVTVLMAPNGDIYYQLARDDLSGVNSSVSTFSDVVDPNNNDRIVVPASEIIHDTMVALYHPLVGVSPIHACGVAAVAGLNITNSSARFFGNAARPSGILTAPAHIGDDTAARAEAFWNSNFSGQNVGKVAVLGDGLKFEPMTMTAVDAQLIQQLRWTAGTVCSTFHVPAYMVGVSPPPSYNNIEALNQQYYSQCLQSLIENIELCLDEGLGLVDVVGSIYGTELDLDGLLRMDTANLYDTLAKGIGAGLIAPNEGRKRIDLRPVRGGDTPYMQQQNYSLAALDKRDQGNPLAVQPIPPPEPAPAVAPPAESNASLQEAAVAQFAAWALEKELAKAA